MRWAGSVSGALLVLALTGCSVAARSAAVPPTGTSAPATSTSAGPTTGSASTSAATTTGPATTGPTAAPPSVATTTTTTATSATATASTTRTPTTTATTAAPTGGDLAGRVVVLDPGHDGANAAHPEQIDRPVPNGRGGTKPCNTTGTSTDAGYTEHAFTWAVAAGVAAALRARGATVVLTRSSDTGVGPCVDTRAAIGNRARADLVLSIHADGAAPAGHGFHVAYSSPALDAVQAGPSLRAARSVRDTLVADGLTPSTYLGDRGLDPRDDLAGLNLATVPTVLVECANMRNPVEAAAVSSSAGRSRYAADLADAVGRWLTR